MTPRILIAELDPAIRRVIHLFLRGHFECFFARSGFEAMRLIEEVDPVVVLTNWDLPDLDTRLFLRTLARKHPGLRSVVYGRPTESERIREAGAGGFVATPLSPSRLVATLERTAGDRHHAPLQISR